MEGSHNTWENPTDHRELSTSRHTRRTRTRVSKRTKTKAQERTASPDQKPRAVLRPPIKATAGTHQRKMGPRTQSLPHPPDDSRQATPERDLERASSESILMDNVINQMAEEMDAAMESLRRRLIEEKRLLFIKEAEIDRIEDKIFDVEVEYTTLRDGSSGKPSAASLRRRERIQYMRAQIEALETEIAWEELALKREDAQQEGQLSPKSRLRKVKEERDSLLTVREASREEASQFTRTVGNLDAELKTLCAIARMAQADEL
jgi:hypothetical protein